ncbi:DUF6155 family protein [Salegentibacter chungangensis]|uniref:DUF6155 family protein n=1 Tax=Salegentibacter chungangensis TaxID=1335724 RepID=A0ABW3NRS5_9FLAO
MSKRALKKYLDSLEKEQLEEQIIDLYERFDEVRVFYNFVFNPKEDKLVKEAKLKIAKEYFPTGKRKPKTRRSVAQKIIKHYRKLGFDPILLADIMLYNIEVAQSYSVEKERISDAFCKSMYKSFEEAFNFIAGHSLLPEFRARLIKIIENAEEQHWFNASGFDRLGEQMQ